MPDSEADESVELRHFCLFIIIIGATQAARLTFGMTCWDKRQRNPSQSKCRGYKVLLMIIKIFVANNSKMQYNATKIN
jgi:hypothetical protein